MDDELSGPKVRKSFWDNTVLIVVIAVVVVFLVLMLSFGAFMYMWMGWINEPYEYEDYRTLNVKGEIDGTDNTLELMVLSGTVYWEEYRIQDNYDYYDYLDLQQVYGGGNILLQGIRQRSRMIIGTLSPERITPSGS